MRYLILAGAVALAGCGQQQAIVLRDPVTQKIHECRDVTPQEGFDRRAVRCAAALEAAGFIRVAQFAE